MWLTKATLFILIHTGKRVREIVSIIVFTALSIAAVLKLANHTMDSPNVASMIVAISELAPTCIETVGH